MYKRQVNTLPRRALPHLGEYFPNTDHRVSHSQISRPIPSRHHISMEHRLRRAHSRDTSSHVCANGGGIDFAIFADPKPLAAALRPQTGTEKHQTVAKEQAKGRQTRAKIGQGDAKGTPRAQNGGQGRRQRAPTPPLASPKTAQHRPKAVPKLAQKYATRRKRETVVENGPPGFARG